MVDPDRREQRHRALELEREEAQYEVELAARRYESVRSARAPSVYAKSAL